MLRIEAARGRTYEERMADAVASIPLISDEWTNHNPSDPGITILENLIAFESLQGARVTDISEETGRALLRMAGFVPHKGKCSRMLLSVKGHGGRIHIKANQKFTLGAMVFETKRPLDVGGNHIKGIYSMYDGKFHDYSYLADSDYMMPAHLFGDDPRIGDSVYFICDSLPDEKEETSFYINVDSRFNRNPLTDKADNIFAAMRWECYTEEGFKEIKVKDYTGAFLVSGEIKMKLGGEERAVYKGTPKEGYCIRATLTKADYDVRPRIMEVNAFLFEVWQKDTKALSLTFQRTDSIHVSSPLADEGYVLCFGREKKGESYRRYELALTKQENGRFCLYEKGNSGSFTVTFDKRIYGYEPSKVKDAVKIVLYNEEVMRQYHVGQVLGYDDQEIELPFSHIVPESFSLIAKRTDENGEDIYDFVRPGKKEDDALTYYLYENDGRIIIEDAGDFIGAELYIGGVALTEGPKGNVRAGNLFEAPGLGRGKIFYNPGKGTGGVFRERLEDVKTRFREDVYTPYACVTEKDYETVTASTPGLCIRKVRAVMDENENLVHISVMPGVDEQFPALSEVYRRAITKTLSERRLITTRFSILSPIYVGVAVRATVYVKRHYLNFKQQIEERLRKSVDYMESSKNFGEVLTFEEVFTALEELECVEYVYELFMRPENLKNAALRDSNIYPGENCLLYAGHIDLETITYEK
ncbi:MAG: baseplate J/gp47 family protein [Lachnospiraceae bacterium]|nr:baseplate J/gp47 family protein [Lachnospiraceae bacterium]